MRYGSLQRIRREQGYTQLQMAHLLGLATRNAYALKERGERRFSIDEGLVIAGLLNCSVEELFCHPQVNKMITNGRRG